MENRDDDGDDTGVEDTEIPIDAPPVIAPPPVKRKPTVTGGSPDAVTAKKPQTERDKVTSTAANLFVSKEGAGKTTDTSSLETEEVFKEYAQLFCDRVLQPYEKNKHYVSLVDSVVYVAMTSIQSVDETVKSEALDIAYKKRTIEEDEAARMEMETTVGGNKDKPNAGSSGYKENRASMSPLLLPRSRKMWLDRALDWPDIFLPKKEDDIPKTESALIIYGGVICAKYLRPHEKSCHYISLLKFVLAASVLRLKVRVIKRLFDYLDADVFKKLICFVHEYVSEKSDGVDEEA